MFRSSQPHSYVFYDTSLTGTSIEDLIRPGLGQAFPLPSVEAASDERFHRLLKATTQRTAGAS